MTPQTKTTVGRIVAGVAILLITLLINAVLADSHRITALETDMKNIKDTMKDSRDENREAHNYIIERLNEIAKDVRK